MTPEDEVMIMFYVWGLTFIYRWYLRILINKRKGDNYNWLLHNSKLSISRDFLLPIFNNEENEFLGKKRTVFNIMLATSYIVLFIIFYRLSHIHK